MGREAENASGTCLCWSDVTSEPMRKADDKFLRSDLRDGAPYLRSHCERLHVRSSITSDSHVHRKEAKTSHTSWWASALLTLNFRRLMNFGGLPCSSFAPQTSVSCAYACAADVRRPSGRGQRKAGMEEWAGVQRTGAETRRRFEARANPSADAPGRRRSGADKAPPPPRGKGCSSDTGVAVVTACFSCLLSAAFLACMSLNAHKLSA
jgi:hypothetical protein